MAATGEREPAPARRPRRGRPADTLIVDLNNAIIAGAGLKGSVKIVPGAPLGSTGEVVAATIHPDGSQSFEALDNCTCSFRGHAGTVTIMAYGRTSKHGVTKGLFLISSGGAANGGLATLAGGRTFPSRPAWPARRWRRHRN